MSENRAELLAGAVVLAAAIGFMAWAGKGIGLGTSVGSYPLHASFRSVEGVVVGTDVRMAGVKVGTVTDVVLNPKTFFADTTISLRDDVILPDDSAILVSSEGLMGGSFIEIIPGGSLDNLAAGDEILDTQGAVSVISLMMKFAGGSSEEAPQ
ncbi:outer membrane lipid asymmetry maintenance protein MlaD [Paenirhodobacter sp. CAU 1674]|uniref:outer membrane lipid asymmetry maintenance protein MlaD n=1 Tax=Paenirhodobacter sp. CAU 1674 TaxID=3032596 RepID=UPI0023DC0291|nr:outer membrane lipid asymmetry maintenance protein MlaD [Paenirhodobacter sp. CAU 1674]MDF2140118.1 outer membrane lipid asymmetry maintenance protein MlaD [Paenirhodobacter sp. CAU 1674]